MLRLRKFSNTKFSFSSELNLDLIVSSKSFSNNVCNVAGNSSRCASVTV